MGQEGLKRRGRQSGFGQIYRCDTAFFHAQPRPDPEPEPTPDPDPQPEECAVYYTVKRYDTLTRIAQRYHTTVAWLAEKNHIQNPNLILVGQRLCVGECGPDQQVRYVVQKGDTLWGIAQRFSTTVDALVQANHIANPNLILVGQILYIA